MKNIFKNLKINQKESCSGFTLVELLVATTIFTVITLGALSILNVAEKVYKRTAASRLAIDNINMVMDYMSREIKFGTMYACANSTGDFKRDDISNFSFLNSFNYSDGDCNAISFIPQGEYSNRNVFYIDKVEKSINMATYVENTSTGLYTREEDFILTSKDFLVEDFLFKLSGISNTDNLQPRVEISLSGVLRTLYSSEDNQINTTSMQAQTVVTQRVLDN